MDRDDPAGPYSIVYKLTAFDLKTKDCCTFAISYYIDKEMTFMH